MAMLEINGRRVEVSDGFMSLSPEQQADEVDEIASHLGIAAQSQPEQPEQPSTWMDMAKTIPAGLARAAASMPGAIGDLPGLAERFADYGVGKIAGKPGEQVRAERMARQQMASEQSGIPRLPNPQDLISTQKILDAIQPVTGELHQPQTTGGKYLDTALGFLPAAISPGGPLQRAGQVLVPAAASETAGQALEGSDYEAAARIAAAIAGGGATALASRRGVPERMAGQAMGALDDTALAAAGRLMIDAEQRGIALTWPEAIQQVTNSGTRLGDLQRVVENSEGGGAIMRDFYADRPQQIDTAARQQFDQIAPQPMIPERLGPRVQRAAEGEIDATQAVINQQTRPLYQAAEQQVLPPNHPALQDPSFIQAVQQVRADPLIGPRLAHLPDNSIGVIDEVQKRLRDDRNALRTQGRGYAASLTGQARQQVSTAARNQSPEYAQAVGEQAYLRDRHLSPLQEGPIGKMAATTDVGAQTRAALPAQPQAQSEAGVARAMRGIGRTDPQAAENIVRQHLETTFNEATQRIQSGQNPFGGAKFSAIVAGNPQQRRNLLAAIRSLPNGDVMWRGFNRFLDVMEATGKRPTPNSATEFNSQIRKELERGTMTGEMAAIAAAPQKAMSFIGDAYKRFRLGRGTEQLARLFTQGNLRDFRQILNHRPGSAQSIAVMVRFLSQVNAASNSSAAPAN